ncbi:sensor histidine kinase [Alishewanella sp. HL-SH05]|uniref:sensor histidine kinase n=1 Tax=Alishewanella sp. HL-SH05 TaxID=3461145 RepID=UPI004041FA2F
MSVLTATSHLNEVSSATVHPLIAPAKSSARSQEQRLKHILQCLPSGVVLLDGWGRVIEVNHVAVEMLGEPLLGESWLNVINRCFRPRSDDGLEVSLTDGRRVKLQISAITPDSGQLIVLTDLTETRELQNRLSHLQRLSTLGKMMATLAHQIRTPLSSAMLYAENLRSPKLPNQSREQFQDKLLARLHDLEQQVNDMLLFARSGTAQAVASITLQKLMDELELRSEALLSHHHATLKISLTSPQLSLLGNKNSLVEALLNLLHNSLQAAGDNAQLCLAQQIGKAGQLTWQFSDNGPGIPPAVQAQMFEPFYSNKAGGSGLGLAVVHAVVHSHQGSIHYVDLAARPEGALSGACFEISLPIHHSASAAKTKE